MHACLGFFWTAAGNLINIVLIDDELFYSCRLQSTLRHTGQAAAPLPWLNIGVFFHMQSKSCGWEGEMTSSAGQRPHSCPYTRAVTLRKS